MYHDEQVAGAIIQERGSEVEGVPTAGAVEVAHIDWSERRIIRHKTRREVGDRDVGHIDGAVGLYGRCRRVAILEFDASNGGGTTHFRSKNQLLGIAVIIVIANREVVGGCGAGTRVEGQYRGSGGVALDAGQRAGAEYQRSTPCTIAVATTVGTNRYGILSAIGQPCEEYSRLTSSGKAER